MKKYLAFTLCLSLCVYSAPYKRMAIQKEKEKESISARSKTGFMLGFENAYLLHRHNNLGTMNVTLGLNAGYNVYFNDKIGMRIFGNYTNFISNVGVGDYATDYGGANRFGFGLDFLYDYFNDNDLGLSLGIFAGLGFGYDLQSYTNVVRRSGFYSYATLGLNIIFNSHNRIDIGYRFTFLNAEYEKINNGNERGTITSPFGFVVGYSYIF